VIIERKDCELIAYEDEDETITIALNIHELENMYLQEEEKYIQKISNLFSEAWQEVSLGEKVISQTIDFFKDESKTISNEIFQIVHMQIR
jgi:hypothetical protein